MTMERAARRLYRLLLHLLPQQVRRGDGLELEAAVVECLARERSRLGRIGTAYACVRAAADVAAAAVVLRVDARRRAAAPHQPVPKGDPAMSSLWQDIRYAARTMRRTPGFSVVVLLTLGVAIGAITAIFSVVDTVLLRRMPFPDADRLVMVYEVIPKAFDHPIGFSPPDYRAFDGRAKSFTSVAAFANATLEMSGVDQPERVVAARASAALFDVLGVQPRLGRAFTRDEDAGRVPVAVLGDGLWRRKFGGRADAIGRTLSLDRTAYTIVGVMPRGFVFPNRGPLLNATPADLFIPISFTNRELGAFGGMYNNSVIARLAPGITLQQATDETRTTVSHVTAEIYPPVLQDLASAMSAAVIPLQEETVGRIQTLLYVLLAAVGTVLLIACADVASLMLTRSAARQREMAIRAALGARRTRLARQVLVEAAVLSLGGGLLGLVLAYWATGVLVSLAPDTVPRLHEVRVDFRVMLFVFTISTLTAMLCGLVPALDVSARRSGDELKEGGRGATANARQRRSFATLVAAQFALAVVLLAGAGLLVRSFARLMAVDPGFRAEHVLAVGTRLPKSAYVTGADVRTFYERLLSRIDALPGVRASGASIDLPLSVRERRAFTIENQPPPSAALPHVVAHEWTMGRYFEVMGVRLIRGRFLAPSDDGTSERVVVINETLARQFWGDRDPIDQRVAWGGPANHGPWMRIVGVVGDVKQGPLSSETAPQTYQPWKQAVADTLRGDQIFGGYRELQVIVRSDMEPSNLAAAIRGQIRELDPSLPIAQAKTMDAVLSASASTQRFNAVVIASFGIAAVLLAALGIGGVLATSVSRRTQEIGVRMALGARRADLLRMIMRQGMTLAVIGLAFGGPAAFALTRLMSSLLFEISPRDPLTFTVAAVGLLTVAAIACYIPARRATRVDPMVALRID